VASLSQGRTAAAQCGLFTHKSVPVIFEPPCTTHFLLNDWGLSLTNEQTVIEEFKNETVWKICNQFVAFYSVPSSVWDKGWKHRLDQLNTTILVFYGWKE